MQSTIHGCFPGNHQQNRRAFTLTEMLVVMAVIGILAAILLPALARSRSKAMSFSCASNSKQLMAAWQMYASENDDRMAPNESGHPDEYLASRTWIDGWLTYAPENPWNTNALYLADPKHATLAHYLPSPKIYRCPSDPVKISGVPRVRSISMNQAMGNSEKAILQREKRRTTLTIYETAQPGEKYAKIYERIASVDQPSDRWVFIDEHPDSINDGSFCLTIFQDPAEAKWWDLPASTHDRGSALSFADGHAERHQWKEANTMQEIRFRRFEPGLPAGDGPDFNWLRDRTTTVNVK